jgi:two-component system OmpR family response regulator
MRILVVEDEHRIAQAIKKGLEQESYAVDIAHSGTDGYDLAMGEVYDAILLDVMIPEMDGITLLSALREKQNHTPVLMLTAKSQVEDRVKGLDHGADDYLTKPFAFEELLARLRALLRRPQTTNGTVLSIDDVTLDTKAKIVMRGTSRIALSQKEYAVLEYLMRHPKHVVTKDQIISHVWDYDADVLPNTVEATIKNLRMKLEKPFPDKKAIIQTVRGFGYSVG